LKPNNSCYEDEMSKTPVKTYADLENELADADGGPEYRADGHEGAAP